MFFFLSSWSPEGRSCRAVGGDRLKKMFPEVSAVWAAALSLCLLVMAGHARGQGLDLLGLNVELEPGQQFSPGWILAAPRFTSNLTYPFLIDEEGVVRYNQNRPYEGFNFDIQENNTLAWFSSADGWWHQLDSSLHVSEIIGYVGADADFHDLELREDDTKLLMGKEVVIMDVIDSVPDSSDSMRSVLDCLLQELDESGNVIWSWRASEHIPPIFCAHCNWEMPFIDAYHQNSFETQGNGDILLSIRNMDMVVLIDKLTGDLVWQLGGPASDFVFTDENGAFAQQHDAHLLEGNRLLLFDNATGSSPLTSRGAEYLLDYEAGTASLLATWPHPSGSFAGSQGSIQRLEGGGTLIGWGTAGSDQFNGGMVSEYSASGSLVGSIYFPENYWSYRARKVPAGQLPLHVGCSDPFACNYNGQTVVEELCKIVGEACDDGNPCTVLDKINSECECEGELPEPEPNVSQCIDPVAINFNPCSALAFDDGTCQYQVEFRVDATQLSTVPNTVEIVLSGLEPFLFEPGGFGTWKGSLVLGNGVWTYEFWVDGVTDGEPRQLDLTWPVDWDGEVVRACLGLTESLCPGCNDPDDLAFSPFVSGNSLCGLDIGVGCTQPGAVNFNPGAFFDDGGCQFDMTQDCQQDLNGDGLIGVSDILEVLTYFGVICD